MSMLSDDDRARLDRIVAALERLAPPAVEAVDLGGASAFVWDARSRGLKPVAALAAQPSELIVGQDRARSRLAANIEHFAAGLPANHVLFWGARGTGKSALMLAIAAEAMARHPALKLVEIRRGEIQSLHDLLPALARSDARVLLYMDDLSFEAADETYKALKSALGGGIEAAGENVLVCATSNRKHLSPRMMAENEDRDAIRRGEAGHELLSLADRFGLSIGFYEPTQAEFLAMVAAHAAHRGVAIDAETLRRRAISWAAERGARSGRTAAQFVADLAAELTVERDRI